MRGRNYRTTRGQAYTRGKYIHGSPPSKISKFMMGDTKSHFEYRFSLVAQSPTQIRHNALEAARVAANKVLFDSLGETGYKIHLRVYPHIVLRENRMIATAGADRLQEGMRRSFGKPSGALLVLREVNLSWMYTLTATPSIRRRKPSKWDRLSYPSPA